MRLWRGSEAPGKGRVCRLCPQQVPQTSFLWKLFSVFGMNRVSFLIQTTNLHILFFVPLNPPDTFLSPCLPLSRSPHAPASIFNIPPLLDAFLVYLCASKLVSTPIFSMSVGRVCVAFWLHHASIGICLCSVLPADTFSILYWVVLPTSLCFKEYWICVYSLFMVDVVTDNLLLYHLFFCTTYTISFLVFFFGPNFLCRFLASFFVPFPVCFLVVALFLAPNSLFPSFLPRFLISFLCASKFPSLFPSLCPYPIPL